MRSGHPEQVVAPRPSESRTNQFDILSEDRTKLPTQRRLGEPEGARPHGSAPPPTRGQGGPSPAPQMVNYGSFMPW